MRDRPLSGVGDEPRAELRRGEGHRLRRAGTPPQPHGLFATTLLAHALADDDTSARCREGIVSRARSPGRVRLTAVPGLLSAVPFRTFPRLGVHSRSGPVHRRATFSDPSPERRGVSFSGPDLPPSPPLALGRSPPPP